MCGGDMVWTKRGKVEKRARQRRWPSYYGKGINSVNTRGRVKTPIKRGLGEAHYRPQSLVDWPNQGPNSIQVLSRSS